MTPATAIALGWGRAPEPGERCACGRDAVIVYPSHEGGTPHCGVNEGAEGADRECTGSRRDGEWIGCGCEGCTEADDVRRELDESDVPL